MISKDNTELVERAKENCPCRGPAGQHPGSASHVVGAIGELTPTWGYRGEYARLRSLLNGKRIDVKTKRCNAPPKLLRCSVAAHGSKQDCDSYVFVRIKIDGTRAWVLGEIDARPHKNATHHRRGMLIRTTDLCSRRIATTLQSASYKTLKPKAQLFKLEANLLTNGNVELTYDSVRPEDFERTMNEGMPEYEGSHSVASLLRYLRTVADEAMQKSSSYL